MGANISKSAFTRGIQCYKSLYLKKHHPNHEDPISESQQAVFDGGTNVGLLAQNLFPKGVDLGGYIPDNYTKAFSETGHLLKNDTITLYEAGFKYNNLLCFMDLLTKKGNVINAYEVKGSTSVKDLYLWDTAFQYYVITSSGYEVNDISVVHLNKHYVKRGEIDVNELFTIVSVKDRIIEMQSLVHQHLTRMNTLLASDHCPNIDIGPHCSDPYACSFSGHCWEHIPEDSVFSYKGIKSKTTWNLYRGNILKVNDIPNDYPLNNTEQLVVSSSKKKSAYIDDDAIRSFCSERNYPLYFLDFETLFMVSIPIYDNSSPFQQIPFQYSLHIQESPDAIPQHIEFLASADRDRDPRTPFIEHLLNNIGTVGDILVYNKTFEKSRLKELKEIYPNHSTRIDNILNRIIDLMVPFRSRYYYKDEMKGSYSIKNVLPALVPHLSYNGLEISNGEAASSSFISLFNETDEVKISETRIHLLKYCELDTWAMVEILNKLQQI